MKRRILYYSTNRELNTERITGFKDNVTFEEALFMGQAPDEGLFMPTRIPELTEREISGLRGKPYHEVAYEILRRFLAFDVSDEDLRSITEAANEFEVPIERLERDVYVARLDRGPTGSFKDFAAGIMARLMGRLKARDCEITVLVATSGDTGSAVGEAYAGIEGIRVFILYPESEVSPLQKRQLDSIGRNVQALAVDGKFDDCQRLVKKAFSDRELASLNLTSANSINIWRVLPQVVYYFYCYVNVVEETQPVVFSVPSGNLGNSLGCEIARRMGLPVKRLIIATNENDEVPDFLATGTYMKVQPSRVCLSNAMNVGNPSNLARFFDLYGGIIDKEGIVHRKPDLGEMRKRLYSTAISDEETAETIKHVYEKYGRVVEPHGAVGIAALMRYFEENERTPSICLETASPAKFPEIIEKVLGISPETPPSLSRLSERKGEPDSLPNDYGSFRDYLLRKR